MDGWVGGWMDVLGRHGAMYLSVGEPEKDGERIIIFFLHLFGMVDFVFFRVHLLIVDFNFLSFPFL